MTPHFSDDELEKKVIFVSWWCVCYVLLDSIPVSNPNNLFLTEISQCASLLRIQISAALSLCVH